MTDGKLNIDFNGNSFVMKSNKFNSITLVADAISIENGKLELTGNDPKVICQNVYSDVNSHMNGKLICPLTAENILLIDTIEKIKHNKIDNQTLIKAWHQFEVLLKLCLKDDV